MNNNKLSNIVRDIVAEEWEKDVEVKSTGEHADKTIAQIKKEMEALKGKKPFNREQFSELMFALRAKQGWKKGKGATKESITMNKTNLKQIIRTELSTLLSENTNTLDRAYKVYSSSLTKFREIAIKLKDNKLQKFWRELDKLHQRITKHLDANYEGALSESSNDWNDGVLPRALYSELEHGEEALEALVKNTRNDKDFIKFLKAHKKLGDMISKHLHSEYPDWEKRMDEDIKNPKKSKANLVKALKKFKKGAKVHYFPLSGGNYVMVGPNGVQTKDKEAVNVQIRKVGTYDADNPNQVSVGIELNNGHEATWNGTEFKIDDLGCPLILGKG
jgi:hypothetical protein